MKTEEHLKGQCENDNDCGPNRYCYMTSKQCVNFTDCTQYNRVNGTISARSAGQCGSCKTGYIAEILADGKESSSCYQKLATNPSEFTIYQIMWIIIILIILLVCGLVYYLITRNYHRRCYTYMINFFTRNPATNTDAITNAVAATSTINVNGLTTASAPQEEQHPFIELAEDKFLAGDNIRRINNEYQTTRVTVLPQWGFTVPHERRCTATQNANRIVLYDNNNVPDTNVPNEGRNIVAQLQNDILDNHSTSMQLAIRLPEFNNEQQDNVINTTLLQTHSSDSDPNSSPEPKIKKNDAKKKNNVNVAQTLNQNIIMNVNVNS